MGIADSGKRSIELLANCLCPAEPGKNAIVDTENYVGFNKFSAAKALEKYKGYPQGCCSSAQIIPGMKICSLFFCDDQSAIFFP